MTVDELIQEMCRMLPGPQTTPDALNNWAPIYYRVLREHEGIKLQAAWDSVLDTWKYQRAPRPAEFLTIIESTPGPKGASPWDRMSNDEIETSLAFWQAQFERTSVGEYGLKKLENVAIRRGISIT